MYVVIKALRETHSSAWRTEMRREGREIFSFIYPEAREKKQDIERCVHKWRALMVKNPLGNFRRQCRRIHWGARLWFTNPLTPCLSFLEDCSQGIDFWILWPMIQGNICNTLVLRKLSTISETQIKLGILYFRSSCRPPFGWIVCRGLPHSSCLLEEKLRRGCTNLLSAG
jgi:hypothetical protein